MSANYLYFLTIDVKTGMRPIFNAALEKLLEAHAKHPKGLSRFTTSYDNIAGAGDRAYLTVEMDALGDQDTWMHTPLLVIEVFGQELGVQILDDWAGSQIKWESQILRRRVDDQRDAGGANIPAA